MARLIEKTVVHVIPVSWYAGGIYRTAVDFQEIVTEKEYKISLTESTSKNDQNLLNPSIEDVIKRFKDPRI
jgi:hypothetical protein